LTAGGVWKELRDEYHAWALNHTSRGDAAPLACQEFPWQRVVFFRLFGKVWLWRLRSGNYSRFGGQLPPFLDAHTHTHRWRNAQEAHSHCVVACFALLAKKDTSLARSAEWPVVAKLLKRHPWLPTVRLFDAAVVVATLEICSPAIKA